MKKLWLMGIVMLLLCVASALAVNIPYNVSNYSIVRGTLDAGNITSFAVPNLNFNVSEEAGVNAIDLQISFWNITDTGLDDYFEFDLKYAIHQIGGEHIVYLQFWNWSSGEWCIRSKLNLNDVFQWYNFTAPTSCAMNETTNEVRSRIYIADNGNTNNVVSIDYFDMTETDVEIVVTAPINETYSTASCPTDTLPKTIFYIFFGLLLVAGLWYCDSKNIGLGLIIVGALTIVYSLPIYGCSIVWGIILTMAGIFIGLYAWKWKYYN